MAEDFYSAFMLRGNIGTSTDVTKVTGVGCYSVATGNTTAPGSAAGVLIVLPPTSKPKRRFIKENDWNTYTLVSDNWQGMGTAAIHDVQTSKDDTTSGRVLINGSALALRSTKANSTGADVTDVNDLPANSISFTYPGAINSPGFTSSILDFSGLNGSYNIQLAAAYGSNGKNFKYRTHNGDSHAWNQWYEFYHTGNKPTSADVGAYSKSESDGKYITNIQLGAQVSVSRDSGGNNKAAAGYVVTGIYSTYQDSNWEVDNIYCKPVQKYINGAWVTISG